MRNFGGHTESAHDVQEVLDADDSDHEIGDIQVTRALRAAFVCLDGVDLVVMFKTRAHVMKSPPKFLRGVQICKRRPALSPELVGHQPDSLVDVEKDRLLKNAKREAGSGRGSFKDDG